MAHMGQNYGYETLMTELPSFMKQVLHFNLKDVSSCKLIPPCPLRDKNNSINGAHFPPWSQIIIDGTVSRYDENRYILSAKGRFQDWGLEQQVTTFNNQHVSNVIQDLRL
jgi:uncharacterized Zn-finger protein